MQARVVVLAGSILAAVFFVGLLSLLMPLQMVPDEEAPGGERRQQRGDVPVADLLLDRASEQYPITIQNLMWIVFFIGAGELFLRYVAASDEDRQFELGLLPQDRRTALNPQDVGPILKHVQETDPDGRHWLQGLLTRAILQFKGSGSVDHVNAVFNSSMDLYHHEVDLRYHMLRYVVWLIPTLGFIGTVVGIALALSQAGQAFAALGQDGNLAQVGPGLMGGLTGTLGVAFYTTLLALLQSAVLMFTMHLVQGREEGVLNRVGQYCLKNFVNRLYEKDS